MEVTGNRLQYKTEETNSVKQPTNIPPQTKENTVPNTYIKQDNIPNNISPKKGSSIENISFASNQQQVYKSYEEALSAADKMDKIKVIIDNKDGTFKIEEVTQKQLESILNNKSNFPNHVSVVAPYTAHGKSLESRGTKMSHEVKLSTKDSSYKINDFLKETDLSNSPRLGAMLNIAGNHKTYNGTRNIEAANKSVEVMQILGNNLSNCRDILNKLSNQRIINTQDATFLKNQLSNVISNAQNLNLSESDISKLNSFLGDITKIESLDAQYKQEEANFTQLMADQTQNINELSEKINKLEGNRALSSDQKNVLGFLKQRIFGDFANKIMNSNDPGQIALYNKFLRNVLEGMESVPAITGSQLVDKMKEYEAMSEVFAKHANNQELTSADKQKVEAYLSDATPQEKGIINGYLSIPAQPVSNATGNITSTSQVNNRNNNSGSEINIANNSQTSSATNSFGPTSNTSRVPVGGFKFDKEAMTEAANLKPSGYSVLQVKVTDSKGNVSTLSDSFKKIIDTGNKQNQSLSRMMSNRVERRQIETKVLAQAPEILPVIKKAEIKNIENIEKMINDEVKKQIEKADALEDKLDLNVDDTVDELVDLLKKFREIINKLDVDSRDVIYKNMAAKMTDESFSKYIKENRERLSGLDKSKSLINEMFNNSTEVKDPSLPDFIKDKKNYDELTKLALIAMVA